jgi:predicted CoA-binding protein
VGLSDNPERYSHIVARYLQERGYRVIPVNPKISEVLGELAYAGLKDIPDEVDVVDIFRAAEYVPAIVEASIASGAKVVWMQEGVIHEEAAARAQQAGLTVVMDRCMRLEHLRLFGGATARESGATM